ncbi:MAG TPA: peptide ABC transporter substrate-binding protein [Clostridia bacterium]|nr:peptide ABC transporter substrate-binding protein [Clostridia bacterium]
MENKRILSIALSVILILSSMMMVFADTSTNSVVNTPLKDKQELNISLYDVPETLDFQAAYYTGDIQVYNWIMEGLTRHAGNGKIKPGIAEKWEVSPNGKEWTFHLRNAKWMDGKVITAQDFVYGWFRAIDPEDPKDYGYFLYDIVNAEEYSIGDAKMEDVGIKLVDNKTIKVTLEQPVTYFDYLVSFPVFAPVRQDVFEKYGENYNTEAAYLVTNGPFKLEKWELESEMVFVKNPTYWDAVNIKLEKVTGILTDDEETEVSMYKTGALDMINHLYYTDKSTFSKDELGSYSDASVWYFDFNCTNAVLKNKNIRKALTYAINRQEFINNVAEMPWKPALAFVTPGIVLDADGKTFGEKKPVYFTDNDVVTAKQLLNQGMAELGLKELPKLTLLVNDTESAQSYGKAFIEMWKKNLGVNVEIQAVTAVERIERQSKQDYQISLAGWGADYPDAMTFLDLFVTDGWVNDAAYSNAQYDSYISAAKAEPDKAKRSVLLHWAEQLLMDEMPIGPLYFRYKDYAVKSYVKNFKRDSFAPDIDFIYSYIEGKK